jgi:outer membrane protein TolC
MRKPLLLLSLCLALFVLGARAQSTINASQKIVGMDTSGAEQKLIRIALTRPAYDVTYRQIRNANHQLSLARNAWLNLLTISLNFNDQEFYHQKTIPGQATYVYPKYFFGVTIPVGLIFSRGSEIRIAKENQAIAKDNREEAERTIIAEVKSKYRTYLNYQNMLAVQNIIVNDEQAVFLQVEKNFRDGKNSIDDYNSASKAFNVTILQQLQYKLIADQDKVDLEQMLGMSLEAALKQ